MSDHAHTPAAEPSPAPVATDVSEPVHRAAEHTARAAAPDVQGGPSTWQRWAPSAVVGLMVLFAGIVVVYAVSRMGVGNAAATAPEQDKKDDTQSGLPPANSQPTGTNIPPAPSIPRIVTADPGGEIKGLLAELQKLEDQKTEGYDASQASNPQEGEVPVALLDPVMIEGFKKDLETEINQPTGKRERTVTEILRIRLRLSEDATRFEYAVFFYKGKEGTNPLTPDKKLAVTTLRLSGTLWGSAESQAFAAKLRLKFRELFPAFGFSGGIRDATTSPLPQPFTSADE